MTENKNLYFNVNYFKLKNYYHMSDGRFNKKSRLNYSLRVRKIQVWG